MGILSGNPKNEPMHYGEVFGAWNYLMTAQGKIAGYQVLINHTGDEDLKSFLEDVIKNELKPEVEQLQELLKANGIALPPAPPERPSATIESIPPGARITDPEVAAKVSMDIAAGLVACSTIMGTSIREDIGAMFGQFHMKKAQFGATLLRLNKEKGWLIPPPLHVQQSEQA
ncbi:DUF3231 family protein [Bacillus songklensis]|uniref:DUF3231 family protein n=1 Tax=Bacillus songklensis TaxID=1069116 RepID=A0ABV8B4U3_9BACI